MRETDPFERARAAQRRTLLKTVGIATALVTVISGILLTVHFTRAARPVLPREIVSGLSRTSFAEPVDRATGWRRLVGVIPPGVVVAAAAIGREGTFAMAFSRTGDVGDRVLSWRTGSYRVAYDTASDVTALGVSPEGETWIGTLQGGILIMRRDGSVVPSAQRTSGTSISQFAFDPASGKTAVLISSGEVFTGLRGLAPSEAPLRAGRLAAVTLPPHARARRVLFDDDGALVLAGDAGAVFAATSSGWDDRTIAATGDVAAIGLDADGTLVAAQSTGHVWRWSGATWAATGHVPHPPLAIGELPRRGLVVATDDGLLFDVKNETDSALVDGYASTVDEPVFAAQVAGENVLFVSAHRARLWAGTTAAGGEPAPRGATWDSASARVGGTASGCQRVGARDVLDPVTADIVTCGQDRSAVTTHGLEPAGTRLAAADAAQRALVGDVAGASPHDALAAACATSTAPPCDRIAGAQYVANEAAFVGARAPDGAPTTWVALYGLSFPTGVATGLLGEPTTTYEQGDELLVRVHVGPPAAAEALEIPAPPLELHFGGTDTGILRLADQAVVLRPGVIATVGAEGAPHLLTLPAPGLVPTSLWRDTGAIAVSPHGDLALLADQASARRILRCHGDACRIVPGPPRDDAPMAVGFTADDHLYVITGDHDVAVSTR